MTSASNKTSATLQKQKIAAVAQTVAAYFGHTLADLRKPGREQPRVFHRQIAMFLGVRLADASYEQVSAFFGKKDHQTCTYATRTILNRIATNAKDAELIDQLCQKCVAAFAPVVAE